jgi:tRNA(Ile)-lysidine synthase
VTIHPTIPKIHTFIAEHGLIAPGSTIVLGLSGGPDSVFLAHVLAPWHREGRIRIIAAHLNHEWRADAHLDEEFCRQLAGQLGIEYTASSLSNLNKEFKYNGSKEEVARQARRFFFQTVRQAYNADAIALAHHADDQQETFFIRLLRGATLTGLAGMKPKAKGGYIRPLLALGKNEILAYLEEHGIAYRIDPTNVDTNFLRNALRMQVIPALRTADKRFDTTFAHTLNSLQKTEEYLDKVTQHTVTEITSRNSDGQSQLSLSQLLALDPIIRDRVVLMWFFNHNIPIIPHHGFLAETTRFLSHSRDGSHQLHTQWTLVKKKGYA